MNLWVWITVIILGGLGIVGVLAVTPSSQFDVQVVVSVTEQSVVAGELFSISGMTVTVLGHSDIIDLKSIGFAVQNFQWAGFTSTISLQVTLAGQSKTLSTVQILPSLPNNSGGGSNTFTFGYISAGTYTVAAHLTNNGNDAADSSQSVCVGAC